MSYQTPITIKAAMDNIHKRKYVMPSIQREFVWVPEQIEKLFDSLMRDYPINTFLFWKVDKTKIRDFEFYYFLKDYHEKDATHNTKADLPDDEDITAVLDGQQRLTSLYIALRGSYAKKLPYLRWDKPNAFPKKHLYLNLLSPADDVEMEYDFRFLTDEETNAGDGVYWYRVSQVLDLTDLSDVMAYLMTKGLTDSSRFGQRASMFALNALTRLFNTIHQKGTISYYLEVGEELDKVLQIFIRTNSGGTKLSYSDLLLSVATAQWNELDAREEIHRFVDEINNIGDGFDFNKDFVLKSCLVLGDFGDVKFKVDNFTKENMLKIEERWDRIASSIRTAVKLISRFGFNRDSLTSSNALIPIAYYVYSKGLDESYVTAGAHAADRVRVKEWLCRALLKKIFSGSPDALYPVYRRLITNSSDGFPLQDVLEHYKGTNKSIAFTDDDVENLFTLEYGKPLTYSALVMLYTGLNQNFRYHQDHLHPKTFFSDSKLRAQGIVDPGARKHYQERFNLLANLQLLEEQENMEKSGNMLDDWFMAHYPEEHERNVYMQQHFFPESTSLSFENFVEFYEARKAKMKHRLCEVLGVSRVEAQA